MATCVGLGWVQFRGLVALVMEALVKRVQASCRRGGTDREPGVSGGSRIAVSVAEPLRRWCKVGLECHGRR